jgi:hypothetical protein
MDGKTIVEFNEITTVESGDKLLGVDISDTSASAGGTNKHFTKGNLLKEYVTLVGEETLTNKTLTSPVVTDVDITGGSVTDVDITGGSVSATTNVVEVLKKVYPVGCIYTSTVSTNPNTLFGFGTWSEYGQGRVLVGKSAEAEFDTAGKTGGAKTHIHRQGGPSSDSSGSAGGSISGPWNHGTFGRSSSGVTFSNYSQIVSAGIGSSKTVYPFLTESTSSFQPYIVVYFWQRTA